MSGFFGVICGTLFSSFLGKKMLYLNKIFSPKTFEMCMNNHLSKCIL